MVLIRRTPTVFKATILRSAGGMKVARICFDPKDEDALIKALGAVGISTKGTVVMDIDIPMVDF